MADETLTGLFGGVGEVRVTSILHELVRPFDCVLACELDAGGSVGAHVQERFSEVVIVTSGSAEISVDGAARVVNAGALAAVPLGAVLAIRNRSAKRRLRYLIVKALPAD